MRLVLASLAAAVALAGAPSGVAVAQPGWHHHHRHHGWWRHHHYRHCHWRYHRRVCW